MGGVRLRHPVFTSATFVVELPNPYPQPYDCNSCSDLTVTPPKIVTHDRKALHLRLDAEGTVIVSPSVYEALRAVAFAGMETVNDVAEPPPLILGAVEQPKYETIEHKLGGDNSRFYLPGRTKYEARDRLHAPFQPLVEQKLEEEDRKKTKKLSLKRRLFVPRSK